MLKGYGFMVDFGFVNDDCTSRVWLSGLFAWSKGISSIIGMA